MTRLDENRAKAQLAAKAGVPVADVTNVAIWGNHSATQFPDFANARIGGQAGHRGRSPTTSGCGATSSRPCRSAAPPSSRPAGSSSAASAANAAIDTVVSLRTATAGRDCFSVAVASEGQYGAPEGLQFGFPVASDGKGGWSVVEGFAHDDFATERIGVTTEELLAERDDVRELGLIG